MLDWKLNTPVALIIFKRPDTTEKVFQAIRSVKPSMLMVIADGPRLDHPGEAEKCAAARAIVDRVDWNCTVLKNYSDTNLGCGVRPATGISWVFEQVEQAIILEDDCVPAIKFFRFCEELLHRYENDTRVMSICGNSIVKSPTPYSYFFSRYANCWGWATWRRAWQHFDFEINQLPDLIARDWLYEFLKDRRLAQVWSQNLLSVYGMDKQHIWDYQWQMACWLQNGLSIRPNANLVINVGFNKDATHTTKPTPYAIHNIEELKLPLNHPDLVTRDVQADRLLEEKFFTSSSLFNRICQTFKIHQTLEKILHK